MTLHLYLNRPSARIYTPAIIISATIIRCSFVVCIYTGIVIVVCSASIDINTVDFNINVINNIDYNINNFIVCCNSIGYPIISTDWCIFIDGSTSSSTISSSSTVLSSSLPTHSTYNFIDNGTKDVFDRHHSIRHHLHRRRQL